MEYDDLPFVEELMFELNDLDRVLHGKNLVAKKRWIYARDEMKLFIEWLRFMQIGMIFSTFSTTNKFIRFLGLTNLQYII